MKAPYGDIKEMMPCTLLHQHKRTYTVNLLYKKQLLQYLNAKITPKQKSRENKRNTISQKDFIASSAIQLHGAF